MGKELADKIAQVVQGGDKGNELTEKEIMAGQGVEQGVEQGAVRTEQEVEEMPIANQEAMQVG